MNYFLYKIKFSTAVHFGSSDSALGLQNSEDHFRSDTLFSAICQTIIRSGNNLNELINMVRGRDLILSDSMPYKGEVFFLPKPIMRFNMEIEVPIEKRKMFKNLKWVPVTENPAVYLDMVSFGSFFNREQAAVFPSDNAVPYEVGLYAFAPDCGLYFIVALRDEEKEPWLTNLITSLGMTGVGGRISSGFGKFEVDDVILLNEPFDDQTETLFQGLKNTLSEHQLMLTSALPDDEELQTVLKNASFQMVRRGGFVQSATYNSSPLKKRTQYFMSAGSVVKERFSGNLFQVGEYGTHPVYRYGIPLFLGVDV